MGGGKLNMVVFLMVVGVAALQLRTSTAQTTHIVLDSLGWIIPQSGGAAAYTAWASNKTFTVGDTLVFNFPASAHTVAEVTKAAFDACTITGPLSLWSTPPVRVSLNSTGEHYYLCTIQGHCSLGQKLAVNVTAAAPTPSPPATPPPSPTPSPVATPPPAAAPSPTPNPPLSPSGSSPSPTPTTPAPSSNATPPAPGSDRTPSAPPPAGITAPPPPNSAASFAAAALPVTFLSVVMALFY